MAQRFRKKNVFVTGAGSGFGRATALAFAREGADSVCLVERLPDRLGAVAAEVEALGARPVSIAADLGDLDACEAAHAGAVEECGRLDVVVSNHAAMSWPTPTVEVATGDWELETRVNLTSHFVLAREAARAMIGARAGGVILFTSSVSSLGAGRGFAARASGRSRGSSSTRSCRATARSASATAACTWRRPERPSRGSPSRRASSSRPRRPDGVALLEPIDRGAPDRPSGPAVPRGLTPAFHHKKNDFPMV